eukprot:EG_transcript_29312
MTNELSMSQNSLNYSFAKTQFIISAIGFSMRSMVALKERCPTKMHTFLPPPKANCAWQGHTFQVDGLQRAVHLQRLGQCHRSVVTHVVGRWRYFSALFAFSASANTNAPLSSAQERWSFCSVVFCFRALATHLIIAESSRCATQSSHHHR